MAKKDKKQTPKSPKNLEGFDISINEFGEIETTLNVEKINTFLDENVEDKKLKGQQGFMEEEE